MIHFKRKKTNKILAIAESRAKKSDTSDKRWKLEEEAGSKGNQIHLIHSISICRYVLCQTLCTGDVGVSL